MKLVRLRLSNSNIVYASSRPDGGWELLEGSLEGGFKQTGKQVTGQLLAPVEPPAILCTGLNYRRHAEETGKDVPQYPILFMKMPSCVQHPEHPIILPQHLATECVDYECELAVVIGKTCRNATKENALEFVLGYTCANDVSARDWQGHRGGGQWCRAKTFDSFCPLGPWIVTADELGPADDLAIETRVNGERLQSSNTSDMIFGVAELIAFYSADSTMLPGTVILTGTPEGVGVARQPPRWLVAGDLVEVSIEGIGTLANPVT